ncbi:hypothetical protein ISR94_03930 [Candidatus Microgenomates bacterium]|nr:hypothetical protein [Candidatus Microgenomates bacterium]
MDEQIKQASAEKIERAEMLLLKAGLVSPMMRFMCESIIKSKSEPSIDELITHLQQLVAEKEVAYQEFKVKLSAASKKLISKK